MAVPSNLCSFLAGMKRADPADQSALEYVLDRLLVPLLEVTDEPSIFLSLNASWDHPSNILQTLLLNQGICALCTWNCKHSVSIAIYCTETTFGFGFVS